MSELDNMRAERDAALAVIEKAPHAHYFDGTHCPAYDDEPCTCWKSTVDTSALAAHDAEKDHRIAELLAVIEEAPHAKGCDALLRTHGVLVDPTPLPCTCWKSTVDTSALSARDEEKWNEGAEATTEWMVNNPSPSGIPHDPPLNPYSALAEGGADL